MSLGRSALWLVALALLVGVFASGIALAANDNAGKAVIVKEVFNKKLKKTILVTGSGMTLYENTTELKGKIHCTGSCRTAWPPLLVSAGGKATAGAGVAQSKLGTLKRPDGGTQVTYKGGPLYRIVSDKKLGDVTGQGVRDLGGTWSAAAPTKATTSSPTPTTTTTTTTTTKHYGY
jgi:predicted lipoprotein with Yx(FWY)xxD motif